MSTSSSLLRPLVLFCACVLSVWYVRFQLLTPPTEINNTHTHMSATTSRMDFGRRMPHFRGNIVMLLVSVAAIATACGAVWGLEKADSGLTNIEEATQDVANDLLKVSCVFSGCRKLSRPSYICDCCFVHWVWILALFEGRGGGAASGSFRVRAFFRRRACASVHRFFLFTRAAVLATVAATPMYRLCRRRSVVCVSRLAADNPTAVVQLQRHPDNINPPFPAPASSRPPTPDWFRLSASEDTTASAITPTRRVFPGTVPNRL